MHEPYLITEIQQGPGNTRRSDHSLGFDPQDCDLADSRWPDIGLGIVLAGAAYPLIAAVVGCLFALVVSSWNAFLGTGSWPVPEEVIGGAIGVGITAIVGAVIGAMLAAIIVIFTTPFLYLFVRSLKPRCDLMLFGAIWGGGVGVIAGLIVFLSVALDFTRGGLNWDLIAAIAIGPAMTTVLGQIGGAWGGVRARRRLFTNYDLVTAQSWREPQPAGNGKTSAAHERAEQPRFQFRIRHMLWIMVWVSVLLSVMRLVGLPLELAVPCIAAWLTYQTATLYLGWRLIRRMRPWWLRPQTQLAGRIL